VAPEALQPWEWGWECNVSESELLACHVSFLCIPSSSCYLVLRLPLFYSYIPYVDAPPIRCSIIFLSDRTDTLHSHSPARCICIPCLLILLTLVCIAISSLPCYFMLAVQVVSSAPPPASSPISRHASLYHGARPPARLRSQSIIFLRTSLVTGPSVLPPLSRSLELFPLLSFIICFPSRDWFGFGLDFLCLCVCFARRSFAYLLLLPWVH